MASATALNPDKMSSRILELKKCRKRKLVQCKALKQDVARWHQKTLQAKRIRTLREMEKTPIWDYYMKAPKLVRKFLDVASKVANGEITNGHSVIAIIKGISLGFLVNK